MESPLFFFEDQHCKPKWVVTTQNTWVMNWVDSLETHNLFNWEYRTQFMYPKLSTTTKKNESGLNDY